MQAEQQSERERFAAARKAAGLREPLLGIPPMPTDRFIYECDEHEFDGWMLDRAALSTPHRAIQDLIKARDTFGWSPEVDEKINALRSLSTQPQQAGWISVRDHLPPDREMVAVAWMDVEDHDHADRYSIDYREDGVWQCYFNEHEHYLIAGVARGNSEDAPYTHWQRIGAIPAPLPPVPGQEGEQP